MNLTLGHRKNRNMCTDELFCDTAVGGAFFELANSQMVFLSLGVVVACKGSYGHIAPASVHPDVILSMAGCASQRCTTTSRQALESLGYQKPWMESRKRPR